MKEPVSNHFGLFQIGAGNLFASMILSGLFLGYLVDQWLDQAPLFMLSFGALGIVGGMIRVHEMLKHGSNENKKTKNIPDEH